MIHTRDISEKAPEGTDYCLLTIRGHSNNVSGFAPFYDDQRKRWMGVSCGLDSTARVWDLNTGTQERELTDPDMTRLRDIAVSPEGSRIFACSGKAIRVWDLDLLRGVDRFADVQSIEQTGNQKTFHLLRCHLILK
eukprot:COSAG06_NODE_12163_length_1415_cov_1.721125_3_plen_136_part_00